MTKRDKLLEKFYAQPIALRYLDLEKLLVSLGFVKIPAQGSHVKFKHPLAKSDLVIPVHNHECKDFYKKYALKFVQANHLYINL